MATDIAAVADTGLVARIARWVELTDDKSRLEAELRKVQDELTGIEEPLLEDMSLAGFDSIKAHGRTVFKQREFTCKIRDGVPKEEAIRAFEDAGLTNCIGLQWQSMRALVRERGEAGEPLPEGVAAVVEVGDLYRLRSRKT